jgi:hypothetical protein
VRAMCVCALPNLVPSQRVYNTTTMACTLDPFRQLFLSKVVGMCLPPSPTPHTRTSPHTRKAHIAPFAGFLPRCSSCTARMLRE